MHLYNFLCWVIGGEDGDFDFSSSDTVNVSERVARQVSSVEQDIVYCTIKAQ